ncbi:MAG: multicopper oxidase domain-containing protein [Desulfovibrionales bacterium]
MRKILSAMVLGAALLLSQTVFAATVEYDLVIESRDVNMTGEPARAMTINGKIPGPVLRFTEGDLARIRVTNRMIEDTSIHWHGLLLPFEMDGVPNLNFPPIAPGTTFTYEFPLRQSGTYWYHSHSGVQEQQGLYGGMVIQPRDEPAAADRDHVVLLSDWTDETRAEVLKTLKRGSHWYSLAKGSSQSILGAAESGQLGAYFQRELARMPAMDISDIAYDRFLANGKPEIHLPAEPGETVRLRIIDGSAATYFHLQFAGGPMTIVSADGLDVEPVKKERFLIAIAETYDVLIQVPGPGAYEFRATAHDGSSHTSVWIGSGQPRAAPDVPKPDLYAGHGGTTLKQVFSLTPAGTMGMPDSAVDAGLFDRPGMHMGEAHDMDSMDHGADMGHGSMQHGEHRQDPNTDPGHDAAAHGTGHDGHGVAAPAEAEDHGDHSTMQHEMTPVMGKTPPPFGNRVANRFGYLATDISRAGETAVEGSEARPWPPYPQLRSVRPTSFDPDKPVREIRLTLDGDMERYVWLLNGIPLSASDDILVREGEVARFIMINRTMMHHPMHLHGHFFRVLNGQGAHAPLKHTVDVAPMSTTVIEFDASERGDWFFHCHILYHMKSGMARVVHYEGFTPDPETAAVRPQLYHDPWYFWGEADLLSSMTEGFLRMADTRHMLTLEWEAGWQEVDTTHWEGIFTAARSFNRFFSVFAGGDILGEGHDAEELRGILGLSYLLPLNIETRIWADTDGGGRISAEREFELTPRLSLSGEVEYDTHEEWEGAAELSYMLSKRFSLTGGWHSEFGWGAGISLRF